VTKLRPEEFKWRQFEPPLILMRVGWYLRFSLSYRDVEELLRERGMSADHVTVWRWVQRYAPELDRRLRSHLKPTNKSWRVDETTERTALAAKRRLMRPAHLALLSNSALTNGGREFVQNVWLPRNAVLQLFLSIFVNVPGGPTWMLTRGTA